MNLHPYENKLLEISKKNDDVIVCTAETRFAMRGIPEMLEDKFLDVGISEQTLIGMAAGLSKMGMLPICHALSAFLLMRPYEFIRTDLGYPSLRSILVGTFNGFISQANGPTHQAIDDISLMSQVPNMGIVCPSNISETNQLMELLVDNVTYPVYLRFNDLDKNSNENYKIQWGKNRFIYEGEKCLIISYGLCLNILEKLFISNFQSIGLLNCIYVRPLDEQFFSTIFDSYNNIIVIEDHRYHGSLCYQLKHLAFENKYIGTINGINLGENFFKPALLEDVLDFEGFSTEKLQSRIEALL